MHNQNIDNANNPITCKQDLLMKSLSEFYYNKDNVNEMLPIINSESNISLRIIDWFVTNYSKKYNIIYNLPVVNKKNEILYKRFVVYLNYKSQLKAYSKKQFDPFCRRDRICFYYEKDKEITTTVGQLNFFRWAIENNILNFIKENLEIIENDMNQSVRNIYSKKKCDNDEKIVESKKFNVKLGSTKTRKKRMSYLCNKTYK